MKFNRGFPLEECREWRCLEMVSALLLLFGLLWGQLWSGHGGAREGRPRERQAPVPVGSGILLASEERVSKKSLPRFSEHFLLGRQEMAGDVAIDLARGRSSCEAHARLMRGSCEAHAITHAMREVAGCNGL